MYRLTAKTVAIHIAFLVGCTSDNETVSYEVQALPGSRRIVFARTAPQSSPKRSRNVSLRWCPSPREWIVVRGEIDNLVERSSIVEVQIITRAHGSDVIANAASRMIDVSVHGVGVYEIPIRVPASAGPYELRVHTNDGYVGLATIQVRAIH